MIICSDFKCEIDLNGDHNKDAYTMDSTGSFTNCCWATTLDTEAEE